MRGNKAAAEAPAGDAELTDTQRRILTAALEVFSERGYDGASTAEIAKRAGVAEKTLFAQFKTKAELLARTVRPSVFLLIEPRAVDRALDALASGTTAEQVLAALMTDRLDLARTHKKKLKLVLHEVLLRPELLESFAGTFAERVAPFVGKTMADLAARGELRTDLPPRTVVRTLVSVILGLAVSRHVLGLEADTDEREEIANVARLVTEGLRPRASTKPAPGRKR